MDTWQRGEGELLLMVRMPALPWGAEGPADRLLCSLGSSRERLHDLYKS